MPIATTDFRNAKNPKLYEKVVAEMHRYPVLDLCPFAPVDNDVFKYNTEGTLPGVSYREYNAEYPELTGVINPKLETLYLFGGDSDYDVKQMKATGGYNMRAAHDVAKAKAQAAFFTNEFFVGDSESGTVTAIDGLRTRLTGSQVIDAGSSDGGDALTLDMLDALIVGVDQQSPDVLFMNMKMWLKVNKLMRAQAQATEPVSGNFGKLYPTYAGIPIAVIGSETMVDPSDGETELTLDPLGFNEPDLDNGDKETTCSIYAVKFGEYKYVSGLQCGPFDIEDCGQLPGTNKERTKLDWHAGLAVFHSKAAARLRGLKDA